MNIDNSERFIRTKRLIGDEASERLSRARVLLFGVGGVGGYAAEALARAGVGKIDIVDSDTVAVSNINRQIIALTSTVGMPKVQVVKDRIREINPDAEVTAYNLFFSTDTACEFDFTQYDYVIDAVDTVSAKLMLAEICSKGGTPLISCMGTGNKLDTEAFRVSDIYKTSGCPLARVMRRELKKRGIKKLTVVYSPEESKKCFCTEESSTRRGIPGTISFVPPIAGFILAGHVIKEIAKIK